jgi:hypothetical protein
MERDRSSMLGEEVTTQSVWNTASMKHNGHLKLQL